MAEADDDTTENDDADAEAAAEDSAPATTDSATEQAPLAIAVTEVDSNQAQQTVATADAQATDRTVEELGLPRFRGPANPEPQSHWCGSHQHSSAGDQCHPRRRQSAMRSMLPRITGLALLWSMAGGPVAAQEGLPAATVQRAQQAVARVSAQPPRFQAERYNPAVLHLRFTSAKGKPPPSKPIRSSTSPRFHRLGNRRGYGPSFPSANSVISCGSCTGSCRVRTTSTSTTRSRPPANCTICCLAASRHCWSASKISTLLIAADRGLQAVPFAALSDGQAFFGERFAFSLTPSLALTDLGVSNPIGRRLLALGASGI